MDKWLLPDQPPRSIVYVSPKVDIIKDKYFVDYVYTDDVGLRTGFFSYDTKQEAQSMMDRLKQGGVQ